MDKLKLCSIVGARPNFIKLAALSPEIRKVADEVIIHTGQHYDDNMSKAFFGDLHIPEPDYNLSVHDATHGEMVGEMLIKLDSLLSHDNRPDAVIVYGDTNSTLAGALAAAKLHIPVIHIEAGERSFDRRMPEETNRVLVDHISDMLFCSTKNAWRNLVSEGIDIGKIHMPGDVMVDLMGIADNCRLDEKDYNLLTVHREENTTSPRLSRILDGLDRTGEKFIFPAHPRTKSVLDEITVPENIRVRDPAGYFEMRCLERQATRIVTDSGGVQKEAYLLKKPCITLRDSTEWIETLHGNWNQLVGTDPKRIRKAFCIEPHQTEHINYLFGAPGVSRRIAAAIVGGLNG